MPEPIEFKEGDKVRVNFHTLAPGMLQCFDGQPRDKVYTINDEVVPGDLFVQIDLWVPTHKVWTCLKFNEVIKVEE